MQVVFSTKSKDQNRYSISNVKGYGKIWFNKGVKTTTDKGLIRTLMNHKLYERGDFHLVTNEEMVANYLEGNESDKLTKELIDGLSIEGIKTLGKVVNAKSSQPTLIKIEAEGKPVTNAVQEILDFYTVKEDDRKKVESKVEEIENVTSKDFTAVEAAEFIENSNPEELEGFLDPEEQRKTVLSAWNKKVEG